jgi:hypothetical protein
MVPSKKLLQLLLFLLAGLANFAQADAFAETLYEINNQPSHIEISPFSGKHQDEEMISPKSIGIHPHQNKIYINALEAGKTLVYSSKTFEKL